MPKRTRNAVIVHARAIRAALSAIDRVLGRLVTLAKAAAKDPKTKRVAKKRKLKLSPERRAQLKLQGQYMGYLRNLKPRQKAQVKAVRVKKGIRAAIAMAKKLAHE